MLDHFYSNTAIRQYDSSFFRVSQSSWRIQVTLEAPRFFVGTLGVLVMIESASPHLELHFSRTKDLTSLKATHFILFPLRRIASQYFA